MPKLIYDYVSAQGQNEIKEWLDNLQIKQRAKVDQKIDMLSMYGDELHPHVLTDSGVAGIQKLRITSGNVQLRPLLCKGPINIHEEYTFLMGAKEVGDKWQPPGAPTTANTRKQAVIADALNRRIEHENII